MSARTISVIGLGYIGLPTAAVIASRGHRVIGVDVNPDTVATINRGQVHIIEPDLDGLVHKVVADGLLRATTVVEPADAFLIAVPTPFAENRTPDLRFVESATRSIAPVLKRGDVVILESTCPVGATEQVAAWLASERPDLTIPGEGIADPDLAIAYCPERVLPGNVLQELVHNDRVIGGLTPACSHAVREIYGIFVDGDCIVTNARTAEMCKLTENSFRDVNIAFANELSVICDRLGIDVWEMIALANRHPRVQILRPGPGVGGHCIAVDPWFIVSSAPEEAKLIATARSVNDAKPGWVIEQVEAAIAAALAAHPTLVRERVTIACLGLAFKPDIDDLRESPALAIADRIASMHPGPVLAVEPNIDSLPPRLAARANAQLATYEEALARSGLIVGLVAHRQFKGRAPDVPHLDVAGIWTGS